MFSFPEFSTSKLSFEPTDTGSGFLCFALWHGNERTWGYVKPPNLSFRGLQAKFENFKCAVTLSFESEVEFFTLR